MRWTNSLFRRTRAKQRLRDGRKRRVAMRAKHPAYPGTARRPGNTPPMIVIPPPPMAGFVSSFTPGLHAQPVTPSGDDTAITADLVTDIEDVAEVADVGEVAEIADVIGVAGVAEIELPPEPPKPKIVSISTMPTAASPSSGRPGRPPMDPGFTR